VDPNPYDSPWLEGLRLPLEREQLEAAKAMAADNKSAQWAAGQALYLLAGDTVEMRRALGAFLWELGGIPTSTISIMTGYSGRELKVIVEADPISQFACLGCDERIIPRDRRHFGSLSRELRLICCSRIGERVVEQLLCQCCFGVRVQVLQEERRLQRLARQARLAQLKRMPFSEYRLTPEWQSKRTQMLSRAGYRCQICGKHDTQLDVHHNSYERYGDERPQDLVVLCRRCHELFHGGLQDAS
jgi:5-methylcytosine-specific restriction endonuclease McrA